MKKETHALEHWRAPFLRVLCVGIGWAPEPGWNSSTATQRVGTPAPSFTWRQNHPHPCIGMPSLDFPFCCLSANFAIARLVSASSSPREKSSCAFDPELTGRFRMTWAALGAGRLDQPFPSRYLKGTEVPYLEGSQARPPPPQLLDSMILSSYLIAYMYCRLSLFFRKVIFSFYPFKTGSPVLSVHKQ